MEVLGPEVLCPFDLSQRDGWIVLPVRAYPGWKAYRGSEEIPVARYMGVFPAFRISAPGKITYRYQPASLRYGLAITALGFLMFFGMVILVVVKARRTGN